MMTRKTDISGGPWGRTRSAQGTLQWLSHWGPCGRGRLGRSRQGGGKPEWLEGRFGGSRDGSGGDGGGVYQRYVSILEDLPMSAVSLLEARRGDDGWRCGDTNIRIYGDLDGYMALC